jgi:hypothetical protein
MLLRIPLQGIHEFNPDSEVGSSAARPAKPFHGEVMGYYL